MFILTNSDKNVDSVSVMVNC